MSAANYQGLDMGPISLSSPDQFNVDIFKNYFDSIKDQINGIRSVISANSETVAETDNTNKLYPVGFTADGNSLKRNTQVSIEGGTITATTFSGALTGNVTGNCSGSSGSCTGTANTATNLAGNPSIQADTSDANKVTITAGNKTSTAYTIPYATKAGSAPASDVSAWAKAASKPSYTKTEVGLGNVANSTYAGGTAITLNGTSKASSTASFFAPTSAGSANQVLISNGSGAPSWTNQSNITAGSASDFTNNYQDMLDTFFIGDTSYGYSFSTTSDTASTSNNGFFLGGSSHSFTSSENGKWKIFYMSCEHVNAFYCLKNDLGFTLNGSQLASGAQSKYKSLFKRYTDKILSCGKVVSSYSGGESGYFISQVQPLNFKALL